MNLGKVQGVSKHSAMVLQGLSAGFGASGSIGIQTMSDKETAQEIGDPNDFAATLAKRVKAERHKKGLSLQALSNLSNISRSMLSQIERAESSPTVATLWNLARALKVEPAFLLGEAGDEKSNILQVMRFDQRPIIRDKGAGCEIHILNSTDGENTLEIYELIFPDGGTLKSSAHQAGAVEHLTILQGAAKVQSDGEMAEGADGDTLRYKADCSHSIEGSEGSKMLLIVETKL